MTKNGKGKKQVKVASLFSGCGGLDLGFLGGFTSNGIAYSRNNTEIVFANDIDKDAADCYNSNDLLTSGGDSCLLGDIREVPLKNIPDFDILLGGFPCQPFSNAGNRKGVNDDNGRGTLFEMCESVLAYKIKHASVANRPKAFLFENVRGILSSKMPTGVSVPDEIKARMEKLGFVVSTNLVCASDYGVPQKRYRVLIAGVRKDIVKEFDFRSLMNSIVDRLSMPSERRGVVEPLVVGSILTNLPKKEPETAVWNYSATTQHMVDNIGPCASGKTDLKLFSKRFSLADLPARCFEGRSWKNVPRKKLSPRFRKIFDNPKKYHAPKFFRRFALGEINGTITASAQPENCGITHPFENRRYSVREAARIQSFPDEYSFAAIPLQSQYKVIGNAVPPVMGWVAANALLEILKEA